MNLRNSTLYLLGILLLVFGNRDTWKKWLKEQQTQREANEEGMINLTRKVDIKSQNLRITNKGNGLENPTIEFHTIRLVGDDLKFDIRKNTIRFETGDIPERASESQ